MERNFIKRIGFFLLAGLFFAGARGAQAQCVAGCNSNYGLSSNNDAATTEYDNTISASVTSAARETDGTFKIWGYGTAANGSSNLLSPTVISSTNYPGLQGTVLKVALGGTSGPNNQSVLLTTEGLYAWGTPGNFIPSALQPNAPFARVNTSGSTYGLPPV